MTIEDIIRAIVREELAAVLSKGVAAPANSAEGTTAAPQKRGRGRPVKGEEPALAAPAAAPAAPEPDPFETAPAAPQPPTATIEEVRAALKALAAATDQTTALTILKLHGLADNLTALAADKYGIVAAAAKAATPAAPAPTPDPFDAPAAPAAKALTLEDVKAVVVATGKRASQETVQKIVMKHGGKAKNPDTGLEAPSLKALPESAFAACVAELQALPATK